MLTSAYIPDVRQVEDFFSSKRDFAIRPQGADYKYVLCSSPRSGSTLIASMLYATGIAGDPLEYLNDQWISVHMQSASRRMEDFNVDGYLAEWETRRTSPNGIFGIKLHHHQMRRMWRGREKEAAVWLGAFDRRILLIRRDKVAQAVSLYRAITSQMWTSKDSQLSEGSSRTVDFNPVRIAELLVFLIKEEEGWRNYMKTNELPFIELYYEDFVNDYVCESLRLLKLLGMESYKAEDVPPPQLARQGRDRDPLIEQFRRTLGLFPPAQA